MTIKKAIIAGALWLVVIIGVCVYALYPKNDDSSQEEEQTRVLSSEDYEKAFNDELKKRLKERGITNTNCRIIAHADSVSASAIEEQTRYTDKWLDSPASKGVGLGISIACATVDDSQKVGEQIELRFKSFYEVTGKNRISYLFYQNNEWVEVMTETITLYCPFLPEGSTTWYSGTVTPPDMPDWSLEGIYPNDMCYERSLDNGDKTHFLARMYDPSTNSCTASNYAGNSEFGVTFNFWYTEGRVIDSNGLHTFRVSYNHPYNFVSSPVNSITSQHYLNSGESGQFRSNMAIASSYNTWYCTYIITNDDPTNTNVVNENNYRTYNNYDYRKFPIYRITNKNYQSYYNSSSYETKLYNQYYIDNGLTIDPITLKTTIDYDTISQQISSNLENEFQTIFDEIYSSQPDVNMTFNRDNNTYDYPEIVNPSSGGDSPAIKVEWDYPQYDALGSVGTGTTPDLPDFEVTGFVPDYSNYTSQTLPVGAVTNAKAVGDIGWNLFDSLGLIPIIIPLVLLALLWKLTGGD